MHCGPSRVLVDIGPRERPERERRRVARKKKTSTKSPAKQDIRRITTVSTGELLKSRDRREGGGKESTPASPASRSGAKGWISSARWVDQGGTGKTEEGGGASGP